MSNQYLVSTLRLQSVRVLYEVDLSSYLGCAGQLWIKPRSDSLIIDVLMEFHLETRGPRLVLSSPHIPSTKHTLRKIYTFDCLAILKDCLCWLRYIDKDKGFIMKLC